MSSFPTLLQHSLFNLAEKTPRTKSSIRRCDDHAWLRPGRVQEESLGLVFIIVVIAIRQVQMFHSNFRSISGIAPPSDTTKCLLYLPFDDCRWIRQNFHLTRRYYWNISASNLRLLCELLELPNKTNLSPSHLLYVPFISFSSSHDGINFTSIISETLKSTQKPNSRFLA